MRFYGAIAGAYGGELLGGGIGASRGVLVDYSTVVLADSPIGYWRLDETAGTVANDEISTNDGTYVNSPTLGAAALVDDGSAIVCVAANSQDVTLPGNTISTTASIELWFKWTGGDTLFRDNTSAGGTGWFAGNSAGNFTVRISGVTNINCGATTSFRDGNRHHLVITKSGVNVAVYVDGVSVGTSGNSATSTSSSPWHLGRNGASAQYADATFDEFAVYDTQLSLARVSAHYAAGIS